MAAPDERFGRELNSWKEIADFLEVSVRTAQRYEAELGLPVRRLGGEKGRAVAVTVSDLAAWKKKQITAPKWSQNPTLLRRYAYAATIVLAVMAVYIIRDLWGHWGAGKPHDSRWEGSTLVVTDEGGREVWRRAFDAPSGNAWKNYIGDLDGNGSVETVVPHVSDPENKGGYLACYSQKGSELWRIQPKRAVSDRITKFSSLYVLRAYQVFPSPEKNRTRWVVAAFVHHYSYPSVTIVVDSKGKVRGEYWHSGHLQTVHTTDLDSDGIEEVLLAGTDGRSNRAVIEVFDPRRVAGAQVLPPDHPNQLLGFPAGTEKARILFERSRLNRLGGHFNFAFWIGSATNPEDRSFQVNISESLDLAQGYLIYTIRPDLSLKSITPSESLRNTYLEYSLKNPGASPFGQKDLAELQRGYGVEWKR